MGVPSRVATLVLGLGASAAVAVSAQTVTVTPSNPQGWHNGDTRAEGSGAITGTRPYTDAGDNGSLQLTTNCVVSAPDCSQAKVEYLISSVGGGFTAFSGTSLTDASFDWYRSSASTANGILAPAFHFLVASTRDGATRFNELVWEYAYNSSGNAPVDSWQHVDLDSQLFWSSGYNSVGGNGPANTSCGNVNTQGGTQLTQTLAAFWAGSCLGTDAVIYGLSVGMGSGIQGSELMFVDNVSYQVGTAAATTFDFQLTAAPPTDVTPEPASMALLATGLVGMAGFGIKRRKQAK